MYVCGRFFLTYQNWLWQTALRQMILKQNIFFRIILQSLRKPEHNNVRPRWDIASKAHTSYSPRLFPVMTVPSAKRMWAAWRSGYITTVAQPSFSTSTTCSLVEMPPFPVSHALVLVLSVIVSSRNADGSPFTFTLVHPNSLNFAQACTQSSSVEMFSAMFLLFSSVLSQASWICALSCMLSAQRVTHMQLLAHWQADLRLTLSGFLPGEIRDKYACVKSSIYRLVRGYILICKCWSVAVKWV